MTQKSSKSEYHGSPLSSRREQLAISRSQFQSTPTYLQLSQARTGSLKDQSLPLIDWPDQPSSVQMMQFLLQQSGQQSEKGRVTAREKEEWGELLTNRYKLQAYKSEIQLQILRGTNAAPYLRFLIFLLEEIERSNIEVSYGEKLSVEFNGRALRTQAKQLQEARELNKSLQMEVQEISREYEKILFNFNSVIQKLVQKESQSPK